MARIYGRRCTLTLELDGEPSPLPYAEETIRSARAGMAAPGPCHDITAEGCLITRLDPAAPCPCSAGVETFMGRTGGQSNDLARLCGKRLVTTSEAEQGGALGESLIKQITGEDRLTARFLYGEYFSFTPTFKIFMATNHKPRIKGGDYGIWRRIKLIPFTVTIPDRQRDRHLGEKLAKENAGILNWLLQGYRDWKKEGLADPESVRSATEEYREDMDTVGTFLKDCCTVDATGASRVRNQDMYAAYMKWCDANSERIGSQKYLALRLEEKGFRRMCSHSVRYWCGLLLRQEWQG